MFFKSKRFNFFILPCAAGLSAAAVALFLYPDLGRNIGTSLYNTNKEILSYSYAVARAAPAVVNIYVSELNNDYSGMSKVPGDITTSASGVILTSDGYIVTNYHVIPSITEPNRALWVQTGDNVIRQAFIVGYDRRTDMAILRINATGLPTVPLNPSYEPKVGDVVFAIGNPNNLGQTVTHGIISATARTGSGLLTRETMNIREGLQDLIQTDAPINSGNSGGALVNSNGELAGINTASFNDPRYGVYGIGFAVPTKLVLHVFNEIMMHGRVIRGYLGISDENSELMADHSINGVRLGYVDPLGPAAGKLKEGDVIVAAGGQDIPDVRMLIDIISGSPPGTELTLDVLREGKAIRVTVRVAEDRPGLD